MHKFLPKVNDSIGIFLENGKPGDTVRLLQKIATTSDSKYFHIFMGFVDYYASQIPIPSDLIHHILIVIHSDLSSDIYVNDFEIALKVVTKRKINIYSMVNKSQIADICEISFPDVVFKKTDKVIYCFKCNWRFGLYCDLSWKTQPINTEEPVIIEEFKFKSMSDSVSLLYRHLLFHNLFENIKNTNNIYSEMVKSGWFPFIEVIPQDYEDINNIYSNPFDAENRLNSVISRFDNNRIQEITQKWWNKEPFTNKRKSIESGINAYIENNTASSIFTLIPQIEGIIRKLFKLDKPEFDKLKLQDLLSYIKERFNKKHESEDSLLLPVYFCEYLESFVFKNFNPKDENIGFGRHSVSHGEVDDSELTKEHALQLILILDQIYFYI